MSETILRIGLDELVTARLRCRACQSVVEVAMDKLLAVPAKCPMCGVTWSAAKPDYFSQFATALQGILTADDRIGVEFVISQPESESKKR